MVGMRGLWIPIVLSAVIVFFTSFIIHMVLPWHKGDYPPVPDEDKLMDALRPFNLAPGDYMVPRPKGPADMKTPEFKAKMERGPKVVMTVMPNGSGGMGASLAQWFVYLLVVSAFSALIGGRSMHAGTDWHHVFHMIAVVAFLGYVPALWQMTIWYRRGLMLTLRSSIDGLIYAAITGGVFVWLWPR